MSGAEVMAADTDADVGMLASKCMGCQNDQGRRTKPDVNETPGALSSIISSIPTQSYTR